MRRSVLAVVAAAGTVGALALAGPADANRGGRDEGRDERPRHGRLHHVVRLSGAQEVPTNAHGHDDSGFVAIKIDDDEGEVCVRFGPLHLTAGEALPTAAHIHRAAVGVAGPVVVALFGTPTTPAAPTAYPTDKMCVTAASALLHEIRDNPAGFYVNLHNATHPSGVVRGQLRGK